MMKATNLNQILNQNNEDLEVIDLSGKNLGLKGTKKLASGLKDYPKVRELNLANTAIGSEGAIVLAKALAKHTTLHKLNLGNNKISTRAIKEIAKVVEKQTNLQELCLNDNRIDDEAVTVLAKALEKHSSLHTLDLSNNLIQANGIKDLFSSLTNHSNFCVLNLKNNSIGSEGAKVLADKLVNHTKLKILNLGNNQIDGEGAVALAGSIGNLSQLQKLNLCNNQIDDKVVKELAHALKDNIGLKNLNLACNQISSEGVTALVQLLENHCKSKSILKFAPALEILNLSDNQIDSSGAENLSKVLKQYTKLQELDLGSNNIGDKGAEAVAKLLAYYNSGWVTPSFSGWASPSLKMLGLHDNQISDKGAHDIAKILQNFKLENLNLSNNAINAPIIKKISDSFKGNKSNLILGNQSPQIEILPVTYSDGLTEDEIIKITECIEEEINKTGDRRKTVRDSVNRMNDQEYIDNKNTILKLITDNTIFTEQNVDCIKDEIFNYKESKNIRSMNIIKNLIQHQNLISSLGNLDHKKSKLFLAQEDIAKIQSLIHNNKLTLDELSKINTDLFKLQSLIDESSNLGGQESNMIEKGKTEKAIFILGNIGAGKSTLANLLLEYELKGIKYGEQFRIDTVNSTDIKISHLSNSETQTLNIREAGDTIVVDCPGFDDSNPTQKTANIYLINELCRAHDQIKFTLVVTFADVLNNKSPRLIKLVKQITNMVEDIDKIKESVSLVVTSVDDDTKKAIINNQIDNILQCNRDLSRNDKIIFEHLKDSVCLFLTPQEEDSLKATPLFSDIKYGKYCTDNITPLVNIEGKQKRGQQELANKMINISNNNFNQIVDTIKGAIKHPLQCLDFANNIFTKNYHLIERSLREAPNYSNGKEDYTNLFNDKDFPFDKDFTKISLLNNLKQSLAGKADSHEDSVKNLTNVIRQFQHFATQGVQDNTVGQGQYIKTLDNYINALQQQYSCIKFFSGISNSPLGGWSKLQDIFNECIVVNDFNLKKLVTSIKIEPSQNEEYYEKALKYLTLYKNEPECKFNIAKAYIELGNIYLAKEDTGKAIDCYGEAIDVYPENPEIYQKLGQIFDKAGCYQQAIECYKIINHASKVIDCFEKWITDQKNDHTLFLSKGDYCKSIGLYEKAKEAYHQVSCLTDDKNTLKNTFYKIANILEDQELTRSNFNKMADEENFYHFNMVDTNFIDGVAETSVKLLGHG
jgi:Ran GTPase-activating protein (RanGAP) involved in mRNA processing and transport/lipopolysaccharide biosynthesis regulator YciM